MKIEAKDAKKSFLREGVYPGKVSTIKSKPNETNPSFNLNSLIDRECQASLPGTGETIETDETALFTGVKFQFGQPVTSLTKSEIAFAQFLRQIVNNHKKQQSKHD
jgi:hypothetical protein